MDEVLKEELRTGKIKKDDFLQPSDPRFKKVYGYDPIADAKKEKMQREKDGSKRKEGLEEKYWNMKKRGQITSSEEKELKEVVLKERGALADKLNRKNG